MNNLKRVKSRLLTNLVSCSFILGLNNCGSGNSAAANGSTLNQEQNITTLSSIVTNNCFSLINQANGKNYTTSQNSQPYYSTATISFTLQNTCNTAQIISNLGINLTGLSLNNQAPNINYIAQSSSNPYLQISYVKTANNLALNVNTPACSGNSCSWAFIPAGSSNTITINEDINAQLTSMAVGSVYVVGSQPVSTTSLTIQTGTVAESVFTNNLGLLAGKLIANSSKTESQFNIGVNSSLTFNNLAASESYTIMLQGMGDAASGSYYSVPSQQTAKLTPGTTTKVNLTFNKVTSQLYNVTFNVNGNPGNQAVTFNDNSGSFKYANDQLNSAIYKFLWSESRVTVGLTPPTGYTLNFAPSILTPNIVSFTANYSLTPPPVVSGLTTVGDQIVDAQNNIVNLKGINWFGFNNSDMLNGMWNYSGLSGDFETTVHRLKALGFNAVRLPFSFTNLNANVQSTYSYPGLTPATTTQLVANLTNPAYSISGKIFPGLNYASGQSYANQYLPNNSVMARFIYVINFFAQNGFYVLIDDHSEDSSLIQNQTAWIGNWKSLVTAIVNGMPAASSLRVMYDIRNEPDAIGYNWTQMGPLYLATMDAINTVTKGNNLFFIEGSGQGGINANWGDGFTTNATLIQQDGLSNPNPFFQSLAAKAYLNQVVLSPHVYPPSVTNAATAYSGTGLYFRLNSSFGILAKSGYCSSGICHRFPIAIGEFGSNFTSPNDLQFFSSFANYLNYSNDAMDGTHNPINSWFYWDYNPNSGDTGGIVQNDWITWQWAKINYLSNGLVANISTNPNGLGLNPWYK